MQKSHENQLLKGDRNTDYFHRIVNGRRRRNTIFSLSCGDEVIEGTNNLLKHATEFYKDLFRPAAGNICKMRENMWDSNEKLTYIDNFILSRQFSETEIKNSVFSMKPNKAPGPDNIPIEFYRFFRFQPNSSSTQIPLFLQSLQVVHSFYEGEYHPRTYLFLTLRFLRLFRIRKEEIGFLVMTNKKQQNLAIFNLIPSRYLCSKPLLAIFYFINRVFNFSFHLYVWQLSRCYLESIHLVMSK